MSLTGVNNNYSPFSQRTFPHYVATTTTAEPDIEQDYERAPPYPNDESNFEDNIGEGALEGSTDSEEENDSEDEEDDDEMECTDSDSDVTEDDQNNSSIQNHRFENGSNFNIHRNGGGMTNGNIINVSNPNNTNSNSNNNHILPPIQLPPVNQPPPMSSSTLHTSTTQPSNRSIGSDLPFVDRFHALSSMSTRNIPSHNPPPPPPPPSYNHGNHGGAYGVNSYAESFSTSQQQTVFRLPNGSHPPPTYSSSTEPISRPSIPPHSSATMSVAPQQKQGSLRFGFPDPQESRDHEVDGEDEDDGSSSTNSYDGSSSRKRARSTSNEWHPQIQFGSLPANRVINRQTMNHNLRAPSTHSSPLPSNRPVIESRIQMDYAQDITDVPSTPLSQPPNFYYHPPRIHNYTAYQQSPSTSASPLTTQVRQQSQFFSRRGLQRRIYQNSNPLDPPSSIRRPTLDEHDNSYNTNFASSGPDLSNVTYHEVSSSSQERRNQHAHNNNTNVSQGQRVPWGPRSDTQRSGRTESLTRPITSDPVFRRQPARTNIFPNGNHSSFGNSLEPLIAHRNNEEPDTNVEIPRSSDGDANIVNTPIPPNITPQWISPVRRSDTTNRHRTVAPTSSSTTTHTSRSSSTDNHITDEQLARRMQAREFSVMQNTHIQNEEHSTIARLLAGTNRARSTSRRDTGSNTSTSSRNGSIRRDTSTRGPIPRLPEILPHHDRHNSEERGNETRSRAHSSRSGQRSGRQSGHFLQHHFIQNYPLLGNFIDSSNIEIDELWDMLPDILGSGIAANPDNYLDEDEFDSSYEGLIQLCESIGDAKPKGVQEPIINSLPTKLYSLGKGKSLGERCTICLTEYENNDRLRDLPCTHDFHQECIDSWLKNSDKCPICRRSVKE